jgi:hypothetical protein
MRIVLARSFHAKSVRLSLPSVNDDMRLGTTFHPLSNTAYQRIPRSMTSAVSSKLSRSDFVHWGKVGQAGTTYVVLPSVKRNGVRHV